MANLLRDHPELRAFHLQNVRATGRRIGSGAYGSVEEGEIPGATCAIKKIHDIFQDRTEIPEDEIQKAAGQFVQECRLMSTLRHPHIVQFLGICALPGSRLPALVMERLLTSLHDLLETRPNVPLGLKHSFLYDTARGLTYLHSRSPPLIHRDLSARNVLLTSAMTAKIGDLGVARIVPSLKAATMTKAPGASIYMPPEALEDESRYDMTIDIFSLGVVAIFTLTQQFPKKLLAPVYRDENRRQVIRNELERRGEYMQLIYCQLRHNHPLVEMIKQCLESYPEDRPKIHQVVRLLECAGAEIDDAECRMDRLALIEMVKEQSEQIDSNELQVLSKNQRIRAMGWEIERYKQQAHAKQQELNKSRESELLFKENQLRVKEEELLQRNHKIDTMEREHFKKVQKLSEHIRYQQTQIEQLRRQVLDVPQGCSEITSSSSAKAQEKPQIKPSKWPLILKWRRGKDLPFGVDNAHTVVLNDHVYIGGGLASGTNNEYIVLKYNPMNGQCSKLPMSTVRYFAMAAVQGQLLLAGGGGKSNEIQLLDDDTHHWTTPSYPKMPTGKTSPAAVHYQNYLIIVCGHYENTVEVLDYSANQWYNAQPVPDGGHSTQSVVCSDHVYVLFRDCDGQCYIYAAHLPTLVLNATSANGSTSSSIWCLLPFPPVHLPTLLVLQNHLLLVGGEGKGKNLRELNLFDPERKRWTSCGQLPVGMCHPSCAVLPSGEIFVAGGKYSQQVWIGTLE